MKKAEEFRQVARELLQDTPGLQVVPKGDPGIDPGLRFFPYTDSGNAERLAKKFAGVVRYCAPQRCWYLWTGRRWEPDQTGEMLQRTKLIARDLYDEASRIDDVGQRKACAEWARKCESAERRKAALFLAQSEPGIAVLAEGLVKLLTGGDTVRARFLYQEAFEYLPQFKLWLAANHAPRVRDDDTAIWRRILRVPFDHVVPKERRDPTVNPPTRLGYV